MTNREMVIAEDFLNMLTDDIDVAFDNYCSYMHNHDESFNIDTLRELQEDWLALVSQRTGAVYLLRELGYRTEGPRTKVKIIQIKEVIK